MERLILIAGLCLIPASLVSPYSFKLVCDYHKSSGHHVEDGRFSILYIHPHLCTHLIFSAAQIGFGSKLSPKSASDYKLYETFNALKYRNTDLKTLLKLNLNSRSSRFRNLRSQEKRITFVDSVIALLRNNKFDGINLRWKYRSDSHPRDKDMFKLLCKDLKEAFDAEETSCGQPRLLLTASVSAEKGVIDKSYNVTEIAKYLDFMNVLTYGLHRPHHGVTKHHSPLYQGSTDTGDAVYYNTDAAMKHWQSKGAPAEKLNLGVATFGRSFTLSDSTDNGVGAAVSGPGEQGDYTEKSDFLAYYEICSFLDGAEVTMITDQKVPYATKSDQWVGYDDMDSIDAKVSYVKENNFGGVYFTALDMDDFSGKFCKQGKYPLLNHLHDALFQEMPVIDAGPCNESTSGIVADPEDPYGFYLCDGIHGSKIDCPLTTMYNDSCKCCDNING